MYIHVKAIPGAKQESIEEIKPGYFAISVREKAEHNAANNRIVEILRMHFKTQNIRIINGHHSPSKLVSIS